MSKTVKKYKPKGKKTEPKLGKVKYQTNNTKSQHRDELENEARST